MRSWAVAKASKPADEPGGKLLDRNGGELRGSFTIHVLKDNSYSVDDTAALTSCEVVYLLERVKLGVLMGELGGWADSGDDDDNGE